MTIVNEVDRSTALDRHAGNKAMEQCVACMVVEVQRSDSVLYELRAIWRCEQGAIQRGQRRVLALYVANTDLPK